MSSAALKDEILTADEIASLTALARENGLTLSTLLETARKARLPKTDTVNIDEDQSPRRTVAINRKRQWIPLAVSDLNDEEWGLIEPHFPCRSRTMSPRAMFDAVMKFVCGHPFDGSNESYSAKAFLSYEVTRYQGNRIHALAGAVRDKLSVKRVREIDALVAYVHARKTARDNWFAAYPTNQAEHQRHTRSHTNAQAPLCAYEPSRGAHDNYKVVLGEKQT